MSYADLPPILNNGVLDIKRAEFIISRVEDIIRVVPELPDGTRIKGKVAGLMFLAKDLVNERIKFDRTLLDIRVDGEKLRQEQIRNLTNILALPNDGLETLQAAARDELTEILGGTKS